MLEPREVVWMTEMCRQTGMNFLEQAKFLNTQNYDVRKDPKFQEIMKFFAQRLGTEKALELTQTQNLGSKTALGKSAEVTPELMPAQNATAVPCTATPTLAKDSADHFVKLKQALARGDYAETFPVGTILPDFWTDSVTEETYDAPLRIVDYRPMKLLSGVKAIAAILLRVYAHPIMVQFDAAEKSGALASCDAFGWNRWKFAGVRVYLNNYGRPGEWWSPTHEYDNQPVIASTQHGYLDGCSDALIQAIEPVMITTNTSNGPDVTEDLFFLPTVENLHWNPEGYPDFERETWQYFQDTPSGFYDSCEKRAFRDKAGKPRLCLTRSAYRGGAYNVWLAYTDGSATSNLAYIAYACAPACAIFAENSSSKA